MNLKSNHVDKFFNYQYKFREKKNECDELVSKMNSLAKCYRKYNKTLQEKENDIVYQPYNLLDLTHLSNKKKAEYSKNIGKVVIYKNKGIFKLKYMYLDNHYVFAESKKEKNKILIRLNHKTINKFDIVEEFQWFNYGCLESKNTLSNFIELVTKKDVQIKFGMVFMVYLLSDKYFTFVKNKESAKKLNNTNNFQKLHKIFNKSINTNMNINKNKNKKPILQNKKRNDDCNDINDTQ